MKEFEVVFLKRKNQIDYQLKYYSGAN